MVLNRDLINERISEVNEAIKLLKELIAKPYEKLSKYEKLSMRYLVIQLVEASASICLHLLIELLEDHARGYPECFIKLGEHKVIPEKLAKKLSHAARLRNLLVHRYWEIDDHKVYNAVQSGLNDFKEFIKHVNSFLAKEACH